MEFIDYSCKAFVEATASADPVPGGGSVSALVGALGAALGSMVGHLTPLEKMEEGDAREFAADLEEIQQIQRDLLGLIQKDIDNFEPLSKLYGMKSDDPVEKERIKAAKQEALLQACQAPIEMIEKCARAIKLSRGFAEKASKVVVSDAGACAVICKAAMQSASFNVYINTSMMKDKKLASKINSECAQQIVYYGAMADYVFGLTTNKIMNIVTEKK